MLRLSIFVVPETAALSFFNKRAVDVLREHFHDFLDLPDPTKVVELRKFLPAFFVAWLEQISTLRSEPKVVTVVSVAGVLAKPFLHGLLGLVAYDDHCVPVVEEEAMELLHYLHRWNRVLGKLEVGQGFHLQDDGAFVGLQEATGQVLYVQLLEVRFGLHDSVVVFFAVWVS